MRRQKPTVSEAELSEFRNMIRGCITCNGTGNLCAVCANASNACRCGDNIFGEAVEKMECLDCKEPDFELSVEVAATAISTPVDKWPSNCFAISQAIKEAGLVPGGELRYGAYLGPVHEKSVFAGKPVVRHGWIEVPDAGRDYSGYVVDPTRWVFTNTRPEIAVIGANSREFEQYDIGSEVATGRGAIPAPRDADLIGRVGDRARVTQVTWPRCSHEFLKRHFGRTKSLLTGQIHWLAQRSPKQLGSITKPVYETLIKAGFKARIPIDYRHVVFKDEY